MDDGTRDAAAVGERRIDSHQHFWKYEPVEYDWIEGPTMECLQRDFLPGDLQAELAAGGIAGTVAVQARQSVAETEWLLELAAANPWIRGVVGWIGLTEPDIADRLAHLVGTRGASPLVGMRHVLQGEPDDFLRRDDFGRGIDALTTNGLTYDILIYARQLPAAIALVDRHPEQRFVLDHCAKPDIRAGAIEPWRRNMREMAARENVVCKLSGLVTEADTAAWSPAQLLPYIDVVFEAFGPDRLMFGSDWPVCTIASTYTRWLETVEGFASALSRSERAALFGGTATRVYDLV